MPHDLFGDAVLRPRTRTPARRILSVLSVSFHAIAVAVLVVVQLVVPGPLPSVHRAVIFAYTPVVPVDLPAPRPAVRPSTVSEPAVSPSAAPLEPPRGISAETGLENATAAQHVEPVGVAQGVASLDGIGVVEAAAAPPPVAATRRPVRLHSGIQPPRKVFDVTPLYPAIAQTARVQGVVILEAVIDASGSVESVKVLRSIPLLDQAAVDAARQWRYTPALLNGEPVPVVMTVTVNFMLER